jgi:hypothetical protein
MEGLPNFPLEFKRIGNYLAKAPNASSQELEVARVAFDKIVGTIYYGSEPACSRPCGGGGHVVVKNL